MNDNKLKKRHIKYEDFFTEIDLQENNEAEKVRHGRGDLILNYAGKEFIFEIKIESYRKLTDNQPIGYLNYLNKQNDQLYFIVPKRYQHKIGRAHV